MKSISPSVTRKRKSFSSAPERFSPVFISCSRCDHVREGRAREGRARERGAGRGRGRWNSRRRRRQHQWDVPEGGREGRRDGGKDGGNAILEFCVSAQDVFHHWPH